MRRIPMIWTTLAMFAAMGLAGCTMGGDDGGGSGTDSTDDGNGSDFGVNGTGNVTAPGGGIGGNGSVGAGGNMTREWSRENRTGMIESGLVPAAMEPEPAEEPVTIENGSDEFYINVTVTGADVDIFLRPPGCEDETCAQTETAAEGSDASFRVAAPQEGEWTAEIRYAAGPSELPAEDSEYEMEIAVAVTMEGNSTTGSVPPY